MQTDLSHRGLRLVKVSKMQAAGVPTVPGSDGLIKDEAEALRYVEEVSF